MRRRADHCSTLLARMAGKLGEQEEEKVIDSCCCSLTCEGRHGHCRTRHHRLGGVVDRRIAAPQRTLSAPWVLCLSHLLGGGSFARHLVALCSSREGMQTM